MKKEIKLVSDFNFDLFYNYLINRINKKKYELIKPNYELFINKCYNMIKLNKKSHIIFIWTRIEGIIKEFDSLVNFKKISHKKLDKEVDNYINIYQLISQKDHLLCVFVEPSNNN